jgi:hypothetical protein
MMQASWQQTTHSVVSDNQLLKITRTTVFFRGMIIMYRFDPIARGMGTPQTTDTPQCRQYT